MDDVLAQLQSTRASSKRSLPDLPSAQLTFVAPVAGTRYFVDDRDLGAVD